MILCKILLFLLIFCYYTEIGFKFVKNLVLMNLKKSLLLFTESFFGADDQYESTNISNINNVNLKNSKNIIIENPINNIRFLNKFFEKLNRNTLDKTIVIGGLETLELRNNRLYSKKQFFSIFLFFFDFIFYRAFPKLPFFKTLFFYITNGNNRVVSKSEIFGRLICCGFEILDYKIINGLLIFAVQKVKKPVYDSKPSYGPIYKMERVGLNKMKIGVYKFRTMHPYSEYVHDFILTQNGYSESGKPADDFRLTNWSKFMRKYWIDELPQLINVLKGDMNIVGLRPVSFRFFQDIPKDLQVQRLKFKPGCIPPYVCLNLKSSLNNVFEADRIYINDKLKNPYFTDLKYLFMGIFNIIFRGKRSS